jgi:hypothetical protein
MIIDVYTTTYNEEKILPYWLRHYETFADKIFVWDDVSTDGTLEILKSHPKVTILPRENTGADDDYFVNNLFPQSQVRSNGYADWVIIADPDEFVYHPKIREVLESQKSHRVDILGCEGYTMFSDNFPTTPGQIYEEVKMGFPDQMESKWTIHSPAIDVHFRKGRHHQPYNLRDFNASRYKFHGIKLLHYRYLGKDFITGRDTKNFEGRKRMNPNKGKLPDARRCPDTTRGDIIEWLAIHKNEALNVLDLP